MLDQAALKGNNLSQAGKFLYKYHDYKCIEDLGWDRDILYMKSYFNSFLFDEPIEVESFSIINDYITGRDYKSFPNLKHKDGSECTHIFFRGSSIEEKFNKLSGFGNSALYEKRKADCLLVDYNLFYINPTFISCFTLNRLVHSITESCGSVFLFFPEELSPIFNIDPFFSVCNKNQTIIVYFSDFLLSINIGIDNHIKLKEFASELYIIISKKNINNSNRRNIQQVGKNVTILSCLKTLKCDSKKS